MSRYKSKYENRYERNRASRYREDDRKLNWGKVIFFILLLIAIVLLIYGLKSDNQNSKIPETSTQNIENPKYYLALIEEKWGVIDNTGKEIIPFDYAEMIVIPDMEKDFFICYTDVDYEENTYNAKVLNKNNEQILSNYEKVEPITFIGSENKSSYVKDRFVFSKEDKIGVIDIDGNIVLEANFTKITTDGNVIYGTADGEEKIFTFFGKEITIEEVVNEQGNVNNSDYSEEIEGYTLKETGNIKYYSK